MGVIYCPGRMRNSGSFFGWGIRGGARSLSRSLAPSLSRREKCAPSRRHGTHTIYASHHHPEWSAAAIRYIIILLLLHTRRRARTRTRTARARFSPGDRRETRRTTTTTKNVCGTRAPRCRTKKTAHARCTRAGRSSLAQRHRIRRRAHHAAVIR